MGAGGSRKPDVSSALELDVIQAKLKRPGPPPMQDGADYLNAGEEDQMEISGYRQDPCLTFLTWCGIVCSVGLLRLVFHWHPSWMLLCTHRRCRLDRATKVLLVDQYKQVFVEAVRTVRPSDIDVSAMLSVTGRSDHTYDGPITLNHLVTPRPGGVMEPTDSLVYFENNKVKYLWEREVQGFMKLRGFDKNVECSYLHQQRGIPVQEEIVRRILYGDNAINVQIQSVFRILFREVLEPFYIFQVFSLAVWFSDNYYYYASCIIIMSALSLITGVYQIRSNQKALHSTVHATDIVTVKRDSGLLETVPSEHLVPGDVIIVPRKGCLMQCDAVLTAGNCIVNESMLTGESVPVVKTPLPTSSTMNKGRIYHPKEHARHTLFCGTKVIQTRFYGNENVEAVVVRTGFLTAKGELVRSIMFPKPVDFKFNRHIRHFLLFLAGLASIGFTYTIVLKSLRKVPVDRIIIRALDIVTIVIPPALPAAMTIGIVFAQSRLRRALVYCISPRSINTSGCVNCFCFDKTGTLTEDGLDLFGVVPASGGKFHKEHRDPRELATDSQFLMGMATCHSLTMIDGQLSGDPLDLKMFEATDWVLEEPDIEDNTKYDVITPTVVRPNKKRPSSDVIEDPSKVEHLEVGIVRELPFSSSMQRMSVVARVLGASHFDVYCKGAPETIASLCKTDSVPSDFSEVLTSYTQRGHRVLALAHRPLTANFAKVHRIAREEVECGLTFLGLLVMENRLKPETTGIIQVLQDANIRSIMVTGDNMLTALSVARDCHMIGKHQQVVIVSSNADVTNLGTPALSWQSTDVHQKHVDGDLPHTVSIPIKVHPHLAVTGKTFAVLREHHPDALRRVAVYGTVFARMAPEQKQQLVELLQEVGYYVGMCGDGANDCGALKAAHAGISLAETEASVASPFTSKVANISCVPTLIKEGRAALVTSFGILKYMACYSMTQFTSVVILYSLYSNLTDLQFLYVDLFLITLFAAVFGRTRPSPVLDKSPPPLSLMGLTPLVSILSQILLVVLAQMSGVLLLWRQSWYQPHIQVDGGDEDEELACQDNYVVFAVSVFQYITLAVIFSKGHPYRKTIFSNYWFLSSLVLMTAMTLYLVLYPSQFLVNAFDFFVKDVNLEFRAACVGLAAAHFVIAYITETYLVQGLLFKKVQLRFFSGSPAYRQLQEEFELQSSPDPWWYPSTGYSAIISSPSMEAGDYSQPACALQKNGDAPSAKPQWNGIAAVKGIETINTVNSEYSEKNDPDLYVTHM
ncbi:polyamine-transporting ATPase 13A3-like isoform X2 [Ornithodoros turicata]|uniref:polyamine-transporting ATPase 13A3-like isoform X2 n=1 Tax=Ornithodoros turicata TaxID=34597 RepID=UPI00313A4725